MEELNKNIYVYKRDVICADVEPNMHFEIQRLIELFQEAATRYFDIYKLGLASRGESNIAILIMDTALKLDETIKWKDDVSIEVWTSKIDRLYIYINYNVIVNKKIIGKAKTRFLLYDIKNKRIKRIDNDILNRIPVVEKKGLNHPEMSKEQFKKENLVYDSIQLLRRNDFDINGHVNNAQYVEIALSAIPDAVYSRLKKQNVEIQYKKECKNRDRMLCKVYANEMEEYAYVVMKDVNEDTVYAVLKIN